MSVDSATQDILDLGRAAQELRANECYSLVRQALTIIYRDEMFSPTNDSDEARRFIYYKYQAVQEIEAQLVRMISQAEEIREALKTSTLDTAIYQDVDADSDEEF